jgi:hypothetical protein
LEARLLLVLLEDDVTVQQTGKNSQFLASFPSCPRPLSLALKLLVVFSANLAAPLLPSLPQLKA